MVIETAPDWRRLAVNAGKRYCIEIDILMQVVALTSKAAHIAASAVDVYADVIELPHQHLELRHVHIGIFQRYNQEISIAAD